MDISSSLQQPVDLMTASNNLSMQRTGKNVGKSMAQIQAAAQDFESVFMSEMIKPMWDGVGSNPVFGGGPGEDAMHDLLVQEYGKSMAKADDFGLGKAVMDVMIKIQNKAENGASYAGTV